jgi:hypothetical protein
MKILEETENFDRRLNKSGRITGQVQKILLESGEEVRHAQCLKLDSSVCKTRYFGFDRTDN